MNAWYREKFSGELERLQELRKSATFAQLIKIDETISIIESCMRGGSKDNEPFTLKDVIKEDREWMLGDDSYLLPILQQFAKTPIFSYRHKYFYTPKLTESDLFDLIRDFFQKALDKDMYKIFRAVFKRRNRQLFMAHLMEEGEISELVYLPFPNRSYIRLRREDSINDLTGLAHEYGHSIQMQTNYHPNLLGENVFFSEVSSIFFELLCFEHLKNFPEFRDAASNEEKHILNKRIDNCSIYILEETLYSICASVRLDSKSGIKTFEKWFKFIVDKSEFKGISLEEMFSYMAPRNLPYYFSHIIALEIFIVYLKDRDRGLYLMKRFISLNQNTPLENYYKSILNLGINPNEHIQEFYDHIEGDKKISF